MKTALLAAISTLGILASPAPAQAGGVGFFVGTGGGYCAPRYARPVCYAPRPVAYCPPRVVYYQPAPVYYAPAPVYYAPRVRYYQPPIVSANVVVGGPVFGWRR